MKILGIEFKKQFVTIYGIKFIMLLCLIPNACKLHKSRISHNKIDAANGQIYKQQGVIKRLILIEIDHLLVSLFNVGFIRVLHFLF